LSLWIRLRKLRTKTGSFRVASVLARAAVLMERECEGTVALAFVASNECDEELSKGLEAKIYGSCEGRSVLRGPVVSREVFGFERSSAIRAFGGCLGTERR
jgi:hypothetical protein